MEQDPSHETTPGGTDSVLDEDTGLPNMFGWEAILRIEEDRCRRYGANPAIIAVEIVGVRGLAPADVSGPDVARLVADTLVRCSRESDTVARVAPARFAVLALESAAMASVVVDRLRGALAAAGVMALFGVSPRGSGLGDALRVASGAHPARWIPFELPPGQPHPN